MRSWQQLALSLESLRAGRVLGSLLERCATGPGELLKKDGTEAPVAPVHACCLAQTGRLDAEWQQLATLPRSMSAVELR